MEPDRFMTKTLRHAAWGPGVARILEDRHYRGDRRTRCGDRVATVDDPPAHPHSEKEGGVDLFLPQRQAESRHRRQQGPDAEGSHRPGNVHQGVGAGSSDLSLSEAHPGGSDASSACFRYPLGAFRLMRSRHDSRCTSCGGRSDASRLQRRFGAS